MSSSIHCLPKKCWYSLSKSDMNISYHVECLNVCKINLMQSFTFLLGYLYIYMHMDYKKPCWKVLTEKETTIFILSGKNYDNTPFVCKYCPVCGVLQLLPCYSGGGVGIAHFNKATQGVANTGCCQWQNPESAAVNSVRIAVLFENRVHSKLFQERCKAAPQRISE